MKVPKFTKAPGVYSIRVIATNRIYIGSSNNTRARLANQLTKLKRQKTDNKELQEAYNLYGVDGLELSEIESHLADDNQYRLERERHWIAEFKDQIINKNLIPTDCSAKYYVVCSPEKDWQLILSLRAFCIKHSLNWHGMLSVTTGEQKLYKGWYCRLATNEEIMQQQILSTILPSEIKKKRVSNKKDKYGNVLPVGMRYLTEENRVKRYKVYYNNKNLGSFLTFGEAIKAYTEYLKELNEI